MILLRSQPVVLAACTNNFLMLLYIVSVAVGSLFDVSLKMNLKSGILVT